MGRSVYRGMPPFNSIFTLDLTVGTLYNKSKE